jgi:serine/threonine-protein kinase
VTAVQDPLFTRVAQALAGDFELLRLLGRGGMATVFLARERALKRLVAVKILDPELGASPIFRSRFEREAETAAQLQHPNIVPIYRVGEALGIAYYAMGYVEGESLAERMQREGRLAPADSVRIAREVADALAAAHRRGIVHRDVKPQNILLDRETGRALVTDFGIARAAIEGPDGDRLTALGLVMGTPRYMSPEQAAGERDVTPAADLYALGVLWYEMLAGAYPYRMPGGAGPMALPFSHPVVPLRERAADVPPAVEQLIQTLMAPAPESRPASGEAVVRAIDGFHGSEAQSASLRPGRRPLSRRARWSAAGAALIAFGVPAFLAVVRPGAPPVGVDPRKSLLIGFFENTTRDPSIEWLRVGGVELLSQSLKRWNDLHVVEVERLLDLARRADVDPMAPLSRDDAVRLAREAGTWTATIGSLLRLGDQVRITVRVYDVTTRRQLTQASIEARPDSTLPAAFGSLANQILDVAGAPRSALTDVAPPTSSLAAWQAYIEGVEARSRWDMPRAAEAFRRAVAADSTFALAYYEWSAALFATEFVNPESRFVALADSALRYASTRPEKERLLIAGYHAWAHGDLVRARELYRRVLALDSTVADAWAGLGDASWADLTLRKDARGRDSMPASFTTALRSYERALALDQSDHRLYASLASMIVPAAVEGSATVPAFRDTLAGAINRLFHRLPVRQYAVVYVQDTLALVPSESLRTRFPRPVLDSLRRRAHARADTILNRWVAAAPGEGQPYLLRAQLRLASRDFAAALPQLDSAKARGATTPVPIDQMRLSVLLQLRRLEHATALADSLAAGGDSTLRRGALTASGQANAAMIAGQLERADVLGREVYAAARRQRVTRDLELLRELTAAADGFTRDSKIERLTRAELMRAIPAFERQLAGLTDSVRPRARRGLGRVVAWAAAPFGDTALVRQWLPADEPPARRGVEAWAAAVAGDRARAEQLVAAAATDTTAGAAETFAMARAAELVGRQADALRLYQRMDSVTYATLEAPDANWLLLVRSYPGRAAIYQAMGDTARSRELYRRFVTLWAGADDALRPEVERVRRALGLAAAADDRN